MSKKRFQNMISKAVEERIARGDYEVSRKSWAERIAEMGHLQDYGPRSVYGRIRGIALGKVDAQEYIEGADKKQLEYLLENIKVACKIEYVGNHDGDKFFHAAALLEELATHALEELEGE